jgi:hypothetical protein
MLKKTVAGVALGSALTYPVQASMPLALSKTYDFFMPGPCRRSRSLMGCIPIFSIQVSIPQSVSFGLPSIG